MSDYLFEKDKTFARMNLNEAEPCLYDPYSHLLAAQIPLPNLVVYLQSMPETLKKGIAKKNFAMERCISGEYLEEVVKAYDRFFFHYKSSGLLGIETSETDLVGRNEPLEELLARLTQLAKGTQHFLPLGSATSD